MMLQSTFHLYIEPIIVLCSLYHDSETVHVTSYRTISIIHSYQVHTLMLDAALCKSCTSLMISNFIPQTLIYSIHIHIYTNPKRDCNQW